MLLNVHSYFTNGWLRNLCIINRNLSELYYGCTAFARTFGYILNTGIIHILLPNLCCTGPDFLFLPHDCLYVKHILLLPYFLLLLFMTRIVNMRMYIFYATNLIKKLKESVHWLLYYKETFILKAGAMQNGIDFQSRNNFFKCLARNKDKKCFGDPGSILFSFNLVFKMLVCKFQVKFSW